MKVIISDIQRFCLHDGPGIRTTVFLKGCSLRCPWCCNPETINFEIEKTNENYKYGYEIDLEDLEKEILKDIKYYENGGGVTFSGGECLLQFDKLEPLLKSLKNQGINICIETSLTVPGKYVDIAIKYVDEFIIDIKILDELCEEKINGNIKLYKNNIEKIFENNCKVIFRIPLVPDYTVTETNLNNIYEFLSKFKPSKVEIFKIHRLGEEKYKSLKRKMKTFKELSNNQVGEIQNKIEKLNIKVEYCKL